MVVVLYLREVAGAAKKFFIVFFCDGKTVDYRWHANETTNILKVNDLNTGSLLKTLPKRNVIYSLLRSTEIFSLSYTSILH